MSTSYDPMPGTVLDVRGADGAQVVLGIPLLVVGPTDPIQVEED